MVAAVELHIERLVLHGIAPRDRRRVGAALQQELTRLLSEQGIPAGWRQGTALDQLKVDGRAVALGGPAEAMGVQIAQAIYGRAMAQGGSMGGATFQGAEGISSIGEGQMRHDP